MELWNLNFRYFHIFMGNIGELIAITGILGCDTDKSRCWEILDQKICCLRSGISGTMQADASSEPKLLFNVENNLV